MEINRKKKVIHMFRGRQRVHSKKAQIEIENYIGGDRLFHQSQQTRRTHLINGNQKKKKTKKRTYTFFTVSFKTKCRNV